MAVDVDEAGGDLEPARVDHALGLARAHVADRGDRVAYDRDVAREGGSTRPVEHGASLQHEVERGRRLDASGAPGRHRGESRPPVLQETAACRGSGHGTSAGWPPF
jgi:hypothetical protein